MRFKVLGPLQVEDDDGVTVAGLAPRQRQVLARLLASAGRHVPSSVLLDELWPDPSSAGASASLHAQVSRLRARLGSLVSIETSSLGYRLALEGHTRDVSDLERIIAEAGAARGHGRLGAATELLARALDLFRGEPYLDIADTELGRIESGRLEALRRGVRRDRIDALLDDGRPADAVQGIDAALVDEPYDEHLWEAKVLALYRLGRPADALDAFKAARRLLRDDLGLEPGPALRELEHRILEHDPTLLERSEARSALAPVVYARNGDAHIAYRTVGEGPVDLVWVPDYLFHLDLVWEHPPYRKFLERLAMFGRLITYDKRGQGLSDRSALPPIRDRAEDLLAVLDACGSERAFLIGSSEGAGIAAHAAAAHPNRVAALVFFGIAAGDPDSEPWTAYLDGYIEWTRYLASRWGTGRSLRALAPSAAEDPDAIEWYGRLERQTIDPGSIVAYALDNARADHANIAHVLTGIAAPSLVMHRRDETVPLAGAKHFADLLQDSRFVELDGTDHLIWYGDTDRVLDEIGRFIDGVNRGHRGARAE